MTRGGTVLLLSLLITAPALWAGEGSKPVPASAGQRHFGLTEAAFKNVATIQHTIDNTGYELIVPKIGPLAMSDLGFGIDKLTVKQAAIEFNPMPPIANLNGLDYATARDRIAQWSSAARAGFITRFGNWISVKGISSGIYNFTQDFNMQTVSGLKRKTVLWNVSVDKDGKAIYGEPKIIDADPLILDANYVTSKAPAELPSTWRFTEGGKIKWRVLDKKLNPLTPWTISETSGAYDSTNAPNKLTGRADCLIDKTNAGCADIGGAVPDIKSLMASTGASFAYINYVSALTPEMEQVGDTQYAKGAISVDQRWWSCGSYTNIGNFGYVLNATMHRFFVQEESAKLTAIPVGAYTGRVISPTEPYSKTVPASSLPGHPDGYIISPHPGDNSIWSRGDSEKMRNVVYISPVGFSGGSSGLGAAWRSASDTVVEKQYDAGGIQQFRIGTVGDNYWGSGVYDREFTFDMSNPADMSQFAIISQQYDDWMRVELNGVQVFNGPNGGDRLEYRCLMIGSICLRMVSWAAGWEHWAELSRNWQSSYYIDLRPYLISGRNIMKIRTIVEGGGEGWVVVQTSSCGSNLGLPTQMPETPVGASGITNILTRK